MSGPGSRLVCDPPQLDWRDEACVRASDYGDVYFSVEDGLEESRTVFLKACNLPEDWQGRSSYVVGELGFGTGLNMLALWQLWRTAGERSGWLHAVTVEKHPLSRDEARRALVAWPELAPLVDQLLAQWPPAYKGAHRCVFAQDRFTLTILQDEAASALSQVEAEVDAWFLDGFAPARNEAMWSQDVFDQIGRLSKPGARIGTFTVAGAVRRGLSAAGFEVSKAPGFGRKRERLVASRRACDTSPRVSPFERGAAFHGPVGIIGGGIAGASLVHALTQRGREVLWFDREGLGSGASGAPAGLLTPRLERADRPHQRLSLAAFHFARRLYEDRPGFLPTGVLRLAKNAEEADRFAGIAELMAEDVRWTGDALEMSAAGQFEPARLVASLAGDLRPQVKMISNWAETADGCVLLGDDGQEVAHVACLIHAGGPHAKLSSVSASAGQVVVLPGGSLDQPRTWGGYVCAAPGGGTLLGSTHVNGWEGLPTQTALANMRAGLRAHLPELDDSLGDAPIDEWQGVRASTPDRHPVIGPCPADDFGAVWAASARSGRQSREGRDTGLMSRLRVLSGLGSRGFSHAPLLAESLVADLCGEPSPLERAGRESLHAARFAWRDLKRNL